MLPPGLQDGYEPRAAHSMTSATARSMGGAKLNQILEKHHTSSKPATPAGPFGADRDRLAGGPSVYPGQGV